MNATADLIRRVDAWSPRRLVIGLMAAGVMMGLTLLTLRGVTETPDTARYMAGASQVLDGRWVTGKGSSYVGYVLFVAGLRSLIDSVLFIVLAQIALGALGVAAVTDLARRLGGNLAGLICGLYVGLSPDLVVWQTYVLPDALYAVVLAGAVWVATRCVAGVGNRAGKLPAVVLLGAVTLVGGVVLVRPNGLAFPASVGLWWSGLRLPTPSRWVFQMCILAALVLAVLFVPDIGAIGGRESPGELLVDGVLVGGQSEWQLAMPDAAAEPGEGVAGVVRYGLHHPVATGQAMLGRVGIQLAHIRPYYGVPINVGRVLLVLPVYLFAVPGLIRLRRDPVIALIAWTVAGQLAVIAVFFADHEGRFLAHLLPLLTVPAAVAASDQLHARGRRP